MTNHWPTTDQLMHMDGTPLAPFPKINGVRTYDVLTKCPRGSVETKLRINSNFTPLETELADDSDHVGLSSVWDSPRRSHTAGMPGRKTPQPARQDPVTEAGHKAVVIVGVVILVGLVGAHIVAHIVARWAS